MKFVWRAVVASLLAVLFLTTVAEASGSTVTNVNTKSHIKVSDKSISKGDDLFIVGKLTSDKHACITDMLLKLFFKGNQVEAKSTNNNGKAFFKRNPNHTGKWQIVFDGKKGGQHPHKYFCKPSRSYKVKVDVKGSGSGVLGTGGANAVSGSGSAPFTGADVLADLRLLAVLLISGLAAIFVARRRVRAGSSH